MVDVDKLVKEVLNEKKNLDTGRENKQEDEILNLISQIPTDFKPSDLEKIYFEIINEPHADQEVYFCKIKKKTNLSIKVIRDTCLQISKQLEIIKEKPMEKVVVVDKRFDDPYLLKYILDELDKTHKEDTKEKIALFLIGVSSELSDPSDRKSAALKGNSSSGKDNLIHTVFKHLPNETNKFLTHTTSAALRRMLDDCKRLALSEMNLHRENGANKDIVETIKQLAEGGSDMEICDKQTGEVISSSVEQKTIFFGTTESESDEELETRHIIIPIHSTHTKNKIVCDAVLDSVSTIKNKKDIESWIANGIRELDNNLEIIIPFAQLLKDKIKDTDGKNKHLFDFTKDRIKRDAKRLMSLTKAITWLYQKQRTIKQIDGIKYLMAEPSDFLFAYEIFAEFFNLTYSGLDHRIQDCLTKIKELAGKHDSEIMTFNFESKFNGWVLRHKLADELGVNSINTIKKYLAVLKDRLLIETHYDRNIPKGYLIRACQQGVNRLSLPITLIALDTLMTAYLTPKTIEKTYNNKVIKKGNWFKHAQEGNTEETAKKTSRIFSQNDTLSNDTVKKENTQAKNNTSTQSGFSGPGSSEAGNSPRGNFASGSKPVLPLSDSDLNLTSEEIFDDRPSYDVLDARNKLKKAQELVKELEKGTDPQIEVERIRKEKEKVLDFIRNYLDDNFNDINKRYDKNIVDKMLSDGTIILKIPGIAYALGV